MSTATKTRNSKTTTTRKPRRLSLKQALAVAYPEVEAPTQAATPAKDEAPMTACKCGCGVPTPRLYRPGHDARHAGQVAKRVMALQNEGASNWRGAVDAEYATLPTQALRDKAGALVANWHRKASIKAKKLAAKEAAAAILAA